MAHFNISAEAEARLHALMEEGNDALVRLREFTIGYACHAKTMLGVSIDEFNDLEDVALGTVNDIPFIAEEDFVTQPGEDYSIELIEGRFVITPGR